MTNEATTPSGQPLGISHKPSKSVAMFTKFKAENKPAFIGYLPYGFPNPDVSLDAFKTMVEHGVDAVEIGLPYSDPVMDGPVIQAAASIALNNGETIKRVFEAVETVANAGGVPLIMSYWNLVYHYGVERFARDFETPAAPASSPGPHPGRGGGVDRSLRPSRTRPHLPGISGFHRRPSESRCGQCAGFRLCCRPHGRHRRTLHHRCVPEGTGRPYPQGRCEKRVRRHRRVHRGTGGSCRIVCGRCHRRLGSGAYHA